MNIIKWFKELFSVSDFPKISVPHMYSVGDYCYFAGEKCKVLSVESFCWNSDGVHEWIEQEMYIETGRNYFIKVRNSFISVKPVIKSYALIGDVK